MKINALTDVRDGAQVVVIVGTHRAVPTLFGIFRRVDADRGTFEPPLTFSADKGIERIDCSATGGALTFLHVEDLDALRGVSLDAIYIEPGAWNRLDADDMQVLSANVITTERTPIISALIGQAR